MSILTGTAPFFRQSTDEKRIAALSSRATLPVQSNPITANLPIHTAA
jgi:hypothetical protein